MILLEASKLFSLTNEEVVSIKTLIAVPFFVGLYFLVFHSAPANLAEVEHSLKMAQEAATAHNQKEYLITTFSRSNPAPLTAFSLNEATLEDLIKQPEIGIKYASLIFDERKKRIFSNWEDFSSRLKSLGKDKIDKLKDQGLKVSSDWQ